MLKQDIVREATRLTRAGQLVEATVLLQRMLRGESAPDAGDWCVELDLLLDFVVHNLQPLGCILIQIPEKSNYMVACLYSRA